MIFVLDLDGAVKLDVPRSNIFGFSIDMHYHGRRFAAKAEERKKAWVRDMFKSVHSSGPKTRFAYAAMNWIQPGVVVALVFALSCRMQQFTMRGRLISVQGTKYSDVPANVRTFHEWANYSILAAILVDVHVSMSVVLHKGVYSRAQPIKRTCRLIVECVMHFIWLIVFRVIMVDWVVFKLLPFSLSAKTSKLRFWNDLFPWRAEYRSDV